MSVSNAKAIGILLMVFGHSCYSSYMESFVNLFHMPLFFFLSGYCFKAKYLEDCKTFAIKRIRGIYLPFVKWSLLFLLLHNVFFHINIYNGYYGYNGEVSHLYELKEFVERAFRIVFGLHKTEQLLGGYWFLKTLFWSSFIAYATILISRKIFKVYSNEIAMILLITIALLCSWRNIAVPFWGISSREILASFFFVFGHWYKCNDIQLDKNHRIISISFVILLLCSQLFDASMGTFTTMTLLPFAVTGIIGTLMVFSIAKYAVGKRRIVSVLSYIGDNTLTILTWHFISFKLVSLLIIGIYSQPIVRLAEFPIIVEYAHQGWWFAYLLVGTIVPLIMAKVNLLK